MSFRVVVGDSSKDTSGGRISYLRSTGRYTTLWGTTEDLFDQVLAKLRAENIERIKLNIIELTDQRQYPQISEKAEKIFGATLGTAGIPDLRAAIKVLKNEQRIQIVDESKVLDWHKLTRR